MLLDGQARVQHQDHPAPGALGFDVLADPLGDRQHVAHPRQKHQQVPPLVSRSGGIDALKELKGGPWVERTEVLIISNSGERTEKNNEKRGLKSSNVRALKLNKRTARAPRGGRRFNFEQRADILPLGCPYGARRRHCCIHNVRYNTLDADWLAS